jgi:hypothetical protein
MTMKTTESADITNSGTTMFDTKDVSCRVVNSLLKYLEALGRNVDSLVEGLPFSGQYLGNSLNWIPYSVREELQDRAVKVTGDERIMYKVGLATPKIKLGVPVCR